MHKKHRGNGFTLIELLIVIAIIAILATIVVVSYVGAQAKARDNKRKADVQTIASAYHVHYQETKTWKFSNAELLKVNSTIPPTYTGEGLNGSGWFNLENTTNYLVGMGHALVSLGYLSTEPVDPQIPKPKTNPVNGDAREYVKFVCAGSMTVYARLESGTQAELDEAGTMCRASDYAVDPKYYMMNYGVTLK